MRYSASNLSFMLLGYFVENLLKLASNVYLTVIIKSSTYDTLVHLISVVLGLCMQICIVSEINSECKNPMVSVPTDSAH